MEAVTLIGAEDVLRASSTIASAAETISRSISSFESSLDMALRRSEEMIDRIEAAAEKRDQRAEMRRDTIRAAHFWLKDYTNDADNATHAKRILFGSITADEDRDPNPAAMEDLTQLVSHAAKFSASSGEDLEVVLRQLLDAMREGEPAG